MNKDAFQTDYLLIGQGIAGTVLGDTLLKNGKKIIVLSNEDPFSASRVAAGLYNPVTGKRMTKTWKAVELFPFMDSFYRQFEERHSCRILHPKPVYKPFASIEEQNTWLSAHEGEDFIDTEIPNDKYSAYLRSDFGGFETKHSGHLNVPLMLDIFREYLIKNDCFVEETFNPSRLTTSDTAIRYGNITASKIIFCEGYKAAANPLFSWLPFVPSKGEILKVRIEDFTEEVVLNKQVFIIPLGNQSYRVGSTYQWVFDSDQPTQKGREELTGKLTEMITMPFELQDHTGGIRPSIKDRKPIIGFHPENKSIAIFNGLGTKGVSLAPYFAENFTRHLLDSKQLFTEVNIERFYSLYSRSE